MSPSTNRSKPCSASQLSVLPDTFEPSRDEMIIGRGRKIQKHPGNIKFRAFVQLKMKDYSDSGDKTVKSFIISDVWKRMKQESSCGGFVKKDAETDKWIVPSDSTVRATIAQAFRDSLSPTYRSSKFSKQRRRWSEKAKPADFDELVPPMTVYSLQRAGLQNSTRCSSSLKDAAVPSPFHAPPSLGCVLSNTADILSRTLKIMDEQEDLVSYTENPFEPDPILEKNEDDFLIEPLESQSFANFMW